MEQAHIALYDYITTRLDNGGIVEPELIRWYNAVKSRLELSKYF
jgi:hypothetical protein